MLRQSCHRALFTPTLVMTNCGPSALCPAVHPAATPKPAAAQQPCRFVSTQNHDAARPVARTDWPCAPQPRGLSRSGAAPATDERGTGRQPMSPSPRVLTVAEPCADPRLHASDLPAGRRLHPVQAHLRGFVKRRAMSGNVTAPMPSFAGCDTFRAWDSAHQVLLPTRSFSPMRTVDALLAER